jgi:RES domain-containing protein
VKVTPHPQFDVFLAQLKATKRLFSRWQGIGFRAAPLEFSRLTKLLDGMGSLKFGGRWSAAGTFPAVNLSLTQEGAVNESGASFTYYNFAPSDVRPKVLVGVRLKLSRVVDWTGRQSEGCHAWMPLHDAPAENWRKANDAGHESISQALGRAAHDVGAEALLVPSARVKDVANLVFFPGSLLASARAEILGRDEIERWLKR